MTIIGTNNGKNFPLVIMAWLQTQIIGRVVQESLGTETVESRMQYLSEINESLHTLRNSNKQLKRTVSQTGDELKRLELANAEQAEQIKQLKQLLSQGEGVSQVRP